MKILLSGSSGQLGWELSRSLLPLGKVYAVSRQQFDLAKPESLRATIRQLKPDVIVNAAAFTLVDQAEQEEELAITINGIAPGILAEEAKRQKALLIHYSTDYVFNGQSSTPYKEDDITEPLNAYGRSKLTGETAIRATNCDHLILRTSWVYAARRNNFVRTMLRLFQEREELQIVNDQRGTPTWSRLIADISAQVIMQYMQSRTNYTNKSGIYHLTAAGETSWFEFASEILSQISRTNSLGLKKTPVIVPVTSDNYPQTAIRPHYSCMATTKLCERFNLELPDWQHCLHLCLDEIFSMQQAGAE